jgi:NCS2 family nucleobase:cation symporter-2/xanthine permease XanP
MTATNTPDSDSTGIRYEPDDPCPPLLLLGVGLQGTMMILATIVLIVAVTARAGGQGDDYVTWAVFAALIISGALIALQASRVWRLGTGHILFMGPTTNFVAVAVLALEAGGPALLASLTVAASFFYLMLAFWLPLLRRVITPVVSGTVLMLIAVSILPIALDRVREVSGDADPAVGPIVALVTLAVTTVLALCAPRSLKPWSPLLALLTGSVVAALLGAFDTRPITDAAWAGVPSSGFPGFDLTPGPDFWALLPAFVVVTLVGVKNMGGQRAPDPPRGRPQRVVAS